MFIQGKYSLRNSYWRELDLYYPHWSSRDLHVVEERYLRICKLSPLDVQLPRWSKIFDPLSALSRIATSKSVLFLIRSVCFYAVFTEKPSMCRAPDSVLITALHLLSLALDVCEKLRNVYTNKYGESLDMINTPNESCTGICYPSEISPVLELSTKPIEAGIGNKSDMRNHHSLISLLVLLLNKYKKVDSDADSMQKSIFNLIKCLLKKFSELNNVCMNELKQLAPDIVSEMPECNKSLSDSETSNKWKLKSRGHQAAIMVMCIICIMINVFFFEIIILKLLKYCLYFDVNNVSQQSTLNIKLLFVKNTQHLRHSQKSKQLFFILFHYPFYNCFSSLWFPDFFFLCFYYNAMYSCCFLICIRFLISVNIV